MVLSKRERGIFWTTLVVMVMVVFDRFVINPGLEALDSVSEEKQRLDAEVSAMRDVLDPNRSTTRARQWQEMIENGLLDDPSAAQSSMLHALEEWSEQSRVRLTSVTPQRSTRDRELRDRGLRDIVFTIAGKGDMASIGEFVWLIEQTSKPVKITNLTLLGSTNASGRDLTLSLKLSLLYLAEEETI